MKKFKKFYIEITNVCNLKCDFCPETKRAAEFMKLETFTKILEQIKPYTDYIYFHVKGEPLLHPEIDKFLDVSYEKGFMVNLTTNGTLIKEVTDKILMKPALRQINFSLHSFDGNEFEQGKDEYINNIFSFVKQATSTTKIITAFRLWNLDTRYSASNNMNIDIFKLLENEFEINCDLKEALKEKNSFKLRQNVYISMGEKFKWPSLKVEELGERAFCYGLRDQIGILVDGTVVPCCLDGEGILNLGNIHTSLFSEILSRERAAKIFQGFSQKKVVEELCRKCGYRERFNK